MSQSSKLDIPCPTCNTMVSVEVWHSLNAQIDPEAKGDLLQGKINTFQCGSCGYRALLPAEFLYHDMENKFCVQLIPFVAMNNNRTLDRFTNDGQLDMSFNLAPVNINNYFQNIRIVFGMEELIHYIIFRDKLALRKAAIKRGHTVCFSCNRGIKAHESYYCVSRLRIPKESPDQKDKRVLDASASLQICSTCMELAATQRIEFKDAPVPLLNLEKEGVHQCAKILFGDTPAKLSIQPVDPSNCTLCRKPIVIGDIYSSIEILEEVSDKGGVTVKGNYSLAVLCEPCGQKYMIWL